jgi:hypothetical protein
MSVLVQRASRVTDALLRAHNLMRIYDGQKARKAREENQEDQGLGWGWGRVVYLS